MAGQRYLRYIIFAVICITLIFFISSSSTTTQLRAPSGSFGDAYKKPRPRPTQSPSPSSDDEFDFVKKPSSSIADDADDSEETLVANPHKPGVSTSEIDYDIDEDQEYEHHAPSKDTESSKNPKPLLGETAPGERMNATFVTLARNSDVWEIAKSIRQVEDRFNRKFHYDWVFLNDQEFDDTFKRVTTSLVSGKTRYGLIPEKHWSFPDFIDQDKAAKVREDMKKAEIIYGDSISYRHMCRFESGFFFWQDLMLEYEWYWRVEPSIELYCDIDYDTFKFMADKKKKYSFTISLYEYIETIPTIWKSAKKFMEKYPEHIAEDNSMAFLSDDGGDTYNKCHFWSNFEIGNLNWLRSQAYTDYFNTLDQDGGFFYERWGDAPVHSIAAGLLLNKDEIHFFNDIAYYHVPFTHCPTGDQYKLDHKCTCTRGSNFDWNGYSCTARFYELHGMEKPEGWEADGEH